jgi:hypothetical protein
MLNISRRHFIAGTGAILACLPTQSFSKLLDAQGNVPQDFRDFLIDHPETGSLVRSYLQSHKFRNDPEKMRASINALSIGLGQYARYQNQKARMEASGANATDIAAMRKSWADETQQLMCDKRALTSPLLVEMCFSLTNPDARADKVYQELRSTQRFLNGSAFLADSATAAFPALAPLAIFTSGLALGLPDAQETADNIRRGVGDEYLASMFRVSQYAFEYLSLEAGTDTPIGTVLRDADVQARTGFAPGEPLQPVDVSGLPPVVEETLLSLFNATVSFPGDPERQANSAYGSLFAVLNQQGKNVGADLARILTYSELAEAERTRLSRENERAISNLRGCSQLAAIFLGEVLEKPEIAQFVDVTAARGIDLYTKIGKFTEEMKSGLGTSIAATALTADFVSFGLTIISMLGSRGPSAEQMILEQIDSLRSDVADLRKVIESGFSRLERFNFHLLERVEQVLHQVTVGFSRVQTELAEIDNQIRQLRSDQSLYVRETARKALQTDIETFLQNIGRGDPSYLASDEFKGRLKALKGSAISYARHEARTFAQSASQDKSSIANALSSIEARKDPETLVGLAGTIVGFVDGGSSHLSLPNPTTWNDGVQAYVSMLLATISDATTADDDALRALYSEGLAAQRFVEESITDVTLRKAAKRYLKAADAMVAKIADYYLRRISEETNNASEFLYEDSPAPFHKINNKVAEVAEKIGLLEYRFGDNPNFPVYGLRPVQLMFKKGPGNWNGLTIGDTAFNFLMGGSIQYDIHSRYDIGYDHGVNLMVMMPPQVSSTSLPYYPDETFNPSADLAGTLPIVVDAKDQPPMVTSRFGPIGQPAETLPTYKLYELIGTAVHEYSRDLIRRISVEVSEGVGTNTLQELSAELHDVDAAAGAFELIRAWHRYAKGLEAAGDRWPKVPRGPDYAGFLVEFFATRQGDRIAFIVRYMDTYHPNSRRSPGMRSSDPGGALIVAEPEYFGARSLLKVDDFDMRLISLREKIAHKDKLLISRIDNMLVAGFRAVADAAIDGLTEPQPEVRTVGGFSQFERGLEAIRVAAIARNLQLDG